MDVSAILNTLPEAAKSPLSLIAFLAVIAAWFWLGLHSKRLSQLLARIAELPEIDRRPVVEREVGRPLPPSMDSEQWIRYERQKHFLFAFLALLAAGLIVFAIAASREAPDPGAAAAAAKAAAVQAAAAQAAAAQAAAAQATAVKAKAAKKVALDAISLVYTRLDDNKLYDMSSESLRQNTGSLAGFRRQMDQWTAQFVEVPVQRKEVDFTPLQEQATGLFESETETGMMWFEQINLIRVNDAWRIASLFVTPNEWRKDTNIWPASRTLSEFASTSDSPEAMWVPPPGWRVSVLNSTATGANRCDLRVADGAAQATLHAVYGSCRLKPGAAILVAGVVKKTNGSVDISQVRFTLQ